MPELEVTESHAQILELSSSEAAALTALGRRLASTSSYWGDDDEAPSVETVEGPERSVIKCRPVGEGRYEVLVTEAVGIVATTTLRLVVVPKIPLSHFGYLVERSHAFPRLADDPTTADPSSAFWELVALWFVSALEAVLRSGLLADYEELTEALPIIRGNINVFESINGFYRGDLALVCTYAEFGIDSPLNRVLRAAALCIASTPLFSMELRRRAQRSLARLEGVGDLRRADLRAGVDRRSLYYRDSIVLAHHVLRATGRAIRSGPERAWSFLIRTPEMIEEGVRVVLRDGLADIVKVERRGLQLVGTALRLQPDLVFGKRAIGDVKYKLCTSEWQRSDLYQITAFASGFRLTHGGLFGFVLDPSLSLPQLSVGEIELRAFLWNASSDVAPDLSAALLVAEARSWITEVNGEGALVSKPEKIHSV